jgi:hypothetical protein
MPVLKLTLLLNTFTGEQHHSKPTPVKTSTHALGHHDHQAFCAQSTDLPDLPGTLPQQK